MKKPVFNSQRQYSEPQGTINSSLPNGPLAEKDVFAMINSAYLKEATKEDKELVQSWTETINIILTFGGLFSAVVTAFLLGTQSDLQPNPIDSTNQILLHILQHQLGNTTDLRPEEPYAPSPHTLYVLAMWHFSLGCSLTSTFGALLSKLWVLHYQSNPRWADAEIDQTRLREARFDSLEKWRMHAIIESLPVILQLAVFLFYLGLAALLDRTKILFIITVFFASLMGALFALTLIAGAFFPSCPYKSSLSSLTNRVVFGMLFWSRGAIITAWGLIYLGSISKKGSNTVMEGIKEYWNRRKTRRVVGGYEYGRGERSIVSEESYSAGVLCWWLQAPRMWKKVQESNLDDVINAVMNSPVKSVMETGRWRRNLEIWSLRVFRGLWLPSPATRHQLQCDMVCYFMHHSDKADASVKLAIDHGEHHLLTYTSTNVYICKAIRHGFATWSTPLPVAKMRPTTLSIYLQYQLLDWAEQETQWNRDLLLQELPLALKHDYFEDLNVYLSSLVNAISLAAIALVPKGTHPEIHLGSSMVTSKLTEQLLQAIHRLSYFPVDLAVSNLKESAQEGDVAAQVEGGTTIQEEEEATAQKEGAVAAKEGSAKRYLVGTVVSGACRAFSKLLGEPQENGLYDSPSWEDGSFAESLSRLLTLGQIWWYTESNAENPKLPGANLVHELHDLILRLPRVRPDVHFLAGMRSRGSEEDIRLSPDIVAQTFASYAHPSGPSGVSDPHTARAAKALDYILGLRLYDMASHRLAFLPGHLPDITLSSDPPPLPGFQPSAHFIRQLICNINKNDLRQLSLSIIVKSHDILLLPSDPNSSSPLEKALKSLFKNMVRCGDPLNTLPEQACSEFTLWVELVDAIKAKATQLGIDLDDHSERELDLPTPPATSNGLIANALDSAEHVLVAN